MTEPIITEDANDDPPADDDGLGLPVVESFTDADVDEMDGPEAPDVPTLDEEV